MLSAKLHVEAPRAETHSRLDSDLAVEGGYLVLVKWSHQTELWALVDENPGYGCLEIL
jgi:hypothetical protein